MTIKTRGQANNQDPIRKGFNKISSFTVWRATSNPNSQVQVDSVPVRECVKNPDSPDDDSNSEEEDKEEGKMASKCLPKWIKDRMNGTATIEDLRKVIGAKENEVKEEIIVGDEEKADSTGFNKISFTVWRTTSNPNSQVKVESCLLYTSPSPRD